MLTPRLFTFITYLFAGNILFVSSNPDPSPSFGSLSWPPPKKTCKAYTLVPNYKGQRTLISNPNSILVNLQFSGVELCDLQQEGDFLEALKSYANRWLKCKGCLSDELRFKKFTLISFTPNPRCSSKPSWPHQSASSSSSSETKKKKSRVLERKDSSDFSEVVVRADQRCNRRCSKESLPPFDRRRLLSSLNSSLNLMEAPQKVSEMNAESQDTKKKMMTTHNKAKTQRKTTLNNATDGIRVYKKHNPSWPKPKPRPHPKPNPLGPGCDFTIASVLRLFGFSSVITEPIIEEKVIKCDNRYYDDDKKEDNRTLAAATTSTSTTATTTTTTGKNKNDDTKKNGFESAMMVSTHHKVNFCFNKSGLCCGVPKCFCSNHA